MTSELQPLQTQLETQTEQLPAIGDQVLTNRNNKPIEIARYFGKIGDKHYVELRDTDPNGKPLLRDITPEALSPHGQEVLARLRAEQIGIEPEPNRVAEVVANSAVGASLGELPFDRASVGSPEKSAKVQLKPENIDRAMNEIDHALGGKLGELLRRRGDAAMIREALDPNTGDRQLRADVEEVLRLGIDELGGNLMLPERVQRNDLVDRKAVRSKRFGYDESKYLARDYAAKLALAVLDGSFDGDVRKLDYPDLPSDDKKNGQHRQAARMVLDHYADQKPQAVSAEDNEVSRAMKDIDELMRRFIPGSIDDIKTLLQKVDQDQLSSEMRELGIDIDRITNTINTLTRDIAVADSSTREEQNKREDLDYELRRAAVHLSEAERTTYEGVKRPGQAAAIRQELKDRLQQARQILTDLLELSVQAHSLKKY